MLVAQQLKRKCSAAALVIADLILQSKFPLVVVHRRLWQFPTMMCHEQHLKIKDDSSGECLQFPCC